MQDCGRRFNPASLEKHRAAALLKRVFKSSGAEVCRSVFGKTRSTFESQNQRLRGVKDVTVMHVKWTMHVVSYINM